MFAKPSAIIRAFGVEMGMHVADFGSGAGHYVFPLSSLVGPKGRVYAIDIQPELLRTLKDLSKQNHISNIEIVCGDLEKVSGSKLADMSVDVVIASNLLFQIEEKGPFIAEIKRVLKPKGRLLLVDWKDSFGHMGPHPDTVVPEEKAKKLFESGGFSLIRTIPAGEHHYALVFQKS